MSEYGHVAFDNNYVPTSEFAFGVEEPLWVKTCVCGRTIEAWRGDSHVICSECGASYNGFGQRLRDDWAGNRSNWDDDVSDMDGYEAQHAGD